MNIFYLDPDPKICAQYHYDKHVVKMILETAQLLSSNMRILLSNDRVFLDKNQVYKITHKNHPSCINHKSFDKLIHVFCNMRNLLDQHSPTIQIESFLNRPFTEPPSCMPDECKLNTGSSVDNYRAYYMSPHKIDLKSYTRRSEPKWMLL